jgi:hypothetical protein
VYVLAFLLGILARPLVAQEPVRLVPSAAVHDLWDKVVACAGPARDNAKTFEEIKFFLRRPTIFQGSPIKGEWVAPDTIYITAGYEREGWVIAHELLHHALNGPPGGEKHPLNPFMFPCGLFEFQQHAGGMNGGTALPTRWGE